MTDEPIELWESPPHEEIGRGWARRCKACGWEQYDELGPIYGGYHICRREGVFYMVRWTVHGEEAQ